MSRKWINISSRGQEYRLEAKKSARGKYTGAYRYGTKNERGHVVLLEDDEILVHRRVSEPRSIGVSDTGRMIFSDWIKYGESTGADVTVFDSSDEVIYSNHFDGSAPLVDISPNGEYIVICPYGEQAYIEDIENEETITCYSYDIADRLVPNFVETDDGPEIELSHSTDAEVLYRIDIHGNIMWHSDEFEAHQYYQVLSLDETVKWEPVVEKCASDYTETDDEQLQGLIANKIGEVRLVDAPSELLQEITELLETYRSTFTKKPAHSRLISQTLGNAYYRLAKQQRKRTAVPAEFWENIAAAGKEYQNVLPWYEGKNGLAKTLRLQANQYHRQQRHAEALSCYEQIVAIEEKFDVGLRSDGDTDRMERYTKRKLDAEEPSETGRLATELYMYES